MPSYLDKGASQLTPEQRNLSRIISMIRNKNEANVRQQKRYKFHKYAKKASKNTKKKAIFLEYMKHENRASTKKCQSTTM